MWINIQPALKIISLKVSTSALKAQIQARPSGVLASLAHLFGMGSVHTLAVSPTGFRKESKRFGSEQKVFVPRPHVSASIFVSSKPVEYLALAVFIFFMGVPATFQLPRNVLPF